MNCVHLRTWIGRLLIAASAVAMAEEPTFRRYNLRCLAPLLESLDAESPKTLEEALLAGPSGSMKPRLDDDRIGAQAVAFPIESEVDEVQAHFDRGVALLHALWYREAERAFRAVVQLDPDGAMGYWGLAMANELRPGRARVFAKAALDRTDANRPALEQRWVGILADYYGLRDDRASEAGDDTTQRSAARIRALEDLVIEYPELVEAKAFMLRQLVLDQYRAGVSITSRLGVEQLVEQLAEVAPGHPSRHYGVFLWLGERPDRGVPFAKEAVEQAEDVAEVWRYAGEALVGAGRSDEALAFYEAALRVDQRYLEEHLLMPWEAENFGRNYEAFVRVLTGMGRIDEAVRWARNLMTFPRGSVSFPDAKEVDLPELGHQLWIEAYAKARLWKQLEDELENGPLSDATAGFESRARRLFWLGICRLFNNSEPGAGEAVDSLKDLHREALGEGVSNQVEELITSAGQSLQICVSTKLADDPKPILVGEDELWINHDLLMAMAAELGLKRDALVLAARAMEQHPDQVVDVAKYMALAFELGQKREAFFRMDRRFRVLAGKADKGLPVIEDLTPLAEEMQLPQPWVLAAKAVPPVMDLEALGPVMWEPPMAPTIELRDALGRVHRLEDFRGKPVVLNFFLGVRCGYCLEQLNVFKPYFESFRKAGIEFVAVSSDTLEVLQQSIELSEGETYKADGEFPFLVLADSDMSAFRGFGVYDDFEGGPLHATVLIDAEGRLVWADRGHAPFKRPASLLAEAQRLVGFPKSENRD
ncbi:redoxin domain-containing protein [Haloferula sp.]|uniref:redoxin domain-containing protein n=1 Tax=Haloferula sp. TaxID=2497595 RepID=UPI003C733625